MTPVAPVAPTAHSHAWLLMVASVVLAVIAAFAFGGDALGDIPGMTWLAASWAAFVLAWVVP